jgi:hypothetical protein
MGRTLQIICGAVLALVVLLLAGDQREPQSHQTDAASQERSDGPPSPLDHERKAQEHPSESERQYRDLTAQEEMARAASVQAAEVRLQTILVGLSVVLGGAAIIISGGALRTAIGSGRRQLRAYLHVERIHVDWAECEIRPRLQVDIENTGETPALRFSIGYSNLTLVDARTLYGITVPADDELYWDHWSSLGGNAKRENAIYPENEMGIPLADLHDQPPNMRMLLTGRVYYMDVFNKVWFTGFAVHYDPTWPVTRPETSFLSANVRAYHPARSYPQ